MRLARELYDVAVYIGASELTGKGPRPQCHGPFAVPIRQSPSSSKGEGWIANGNGEQ